MHVYFVRHGKSTANVESILSTQDPQLHPLTETGRGQALEVGAKLAEVPIAAAYSSDLLRAVETAEIILDGRAVPLETTPLLREHNVGELEGRHDEAAWQTLVSYFDAWMQGDLAAGPPGGENYIELNQRFQRFARQLVERHGDDANGSACRRARRLLLGRLPQPVRQCRSGFHAGAGRQQWGCDHRAVRAGALGVPGMGGGNAVPRRIA